MKKFAYYSDLLFCFLTVGLFFLCLLRYEGLSLLPALFLGGCFGGSATLLLSFFLCRKQNAVLLKKRESEEAEKLALHLSLLSKEELASFLRQPLGCQTYLKNGECFGALEEKILLFKFSPTPLTAEGVLPLLYESGEHPAELYVYAISSECEQFCNRFGISIVKIPQLFQALQKQTALPTVYKSERAFQKQKRNRLRLRFSKKGSTRFFMSGAMLLLFSLVVPFPYYYLLFGGILVAASLFIRVFGTAS